ncbi:IS4 family transposase [Dictyobacter aurantiacus]|nr:IS4 family transposase [Dictyobacter aurantiacus]GCE04850.1 hypothetical protein KDAU_21790 [Dictyobacter aurantiacus]GCE06097.1 hypothetical protein KDAU_34260 [Dictyobacter aurantiacus]GCE06769.1 hypothetical protein KDAU_40980 [Dictyobacter aurantiacus]GCE06996.1 hypothetical protein KDAU_43250 [Dictyobacter aurantiacus]GCE07073.1 hypothetical protein KDAU_44020 [Dictyobacter aurantiacus]
MPHHTASGPEEANADSLSQQIVGCLQRLIEPSDPPAAAVSRPRGRPAVLSSEHLCLAVLLALLRGLKSYACVWRLITWSGVGHFPLLPHTRDAIRKRLLHTSLDVWQRLLLRVSTGLHAQTQAVAQCDLLPWVSHIFALDQTTLDAVQRRMQDVRDEAVDSPRLLVGRLAALFDVRRQQWVRILFREDVFANEKLLVQDVVRGLPAGSLLLADLGYFSFPWFDWLTDQGFFWLSRMREKTSYQILHVFVQQGTTLDALVWLGAYRADRCAHRVRLIQFEHHGKLYQYLTNICEPDRLSMSEAARLYARRWEIELAFKALKCTLGIRVWWSCDPLLVLQQLFAAFILAQVLHALHAQVAFAAQVPLFDVSLPVLATLLAQAPTRSGGQPLIQRLLEVGRRQGLIRPSRRIEPAVPALLRSYTPAPPDLPTIRPPRYAHRVRQGRSDRPDFVPRFFTFIVI